MYNLQNIKSDEVFKHFYNISQIPRGSGNEKEISDYLVSFAKNLNLEVIQDEANNVIIKKPATKGYENAPTVIIQGHMDMVWEKNSGTIHDCHKDPLKLAVKDDYIYAEGTTLGADDGIAVAYAMAILESNSIEHPNIEVLITTDEETGMSGAMAVKKENINGTILLNLDNEEEGHLLVSCAGGIRTKSIINYEKEKINNEEVFIIKVKGLKGGHSGADIHLGRGNSNKIIGRVLNTINSKINMNLVSVNGGTKDNAIPRESEAVITVNDSETLKEIIKSLNETLKNELQYTDSNVNITLEKADCNISYKIKKEFSDNIINLLYLYPNGVNTMSGSIENLTESSTNLGIVKTTDNKVTFDSAVRSSVETLKDEIVNRIRTVTEMSKGEFETHAPYPGWEYKKESKLRDLCKDIYTKMFNKEPVIYAIHAGVECGLFQEKLGDIDMISMGPDIIDIHTPNEHLSISSTKRVWEYLKEILKNIK